MSSTEDSGGEAPPPESTKVGRKVALPEGLPPDTRETFRSPTVDDGSRAPEQIEGQSAALTTFLRFHPFMAFFCWLAHLQYEPEHTDSRRISIHRKRCPRFYWTCVTLDMLITFAVTVTIVGTAVGVAYKTLFA